MKINKDQYFNNLTGYKISNSHFELGSNLHISDYYYAKRIFYNSFYTNRFAFLIAKYILNSFKELIESKINSKSENPKEKTITLIGYDNFSELLVSNVRKMLNDYFLSNRGLIHELFNHDIYTKDSVFLKNPDKISQNIISIFPISTTFSTSVKIQAEISDILSSEVYMNNNVCFHNPIINCLLISNGTLLLNQNFNDSNIEYEFGWKKFEHANRLITMKSFDNPSSKFVQHFFIDLPTEWQKINVCNSCYPPNYENEKCLIETKTAAATPNLIFSYPKSTKFENQKDIYNLFGFHPSKEGTVYRKHFKKFNNNYIYYIRTGSFLKNNKLMVDNWLINKRNELIELKDKNIVIVTPTLGSNSGFVNLVNDLLFSDTATIIQYNPSDDYQYNFRTFYSGILELADKIVFIDDILFTTNTFSEINFYVKNIERKDESKGIDLCLTMINRSGYYNYESLKELLNVTADDNPKSKIISFVDINVAPILHRKTYPYDKLTSKFNLLSSKSVLDEMRLHFRKKEYHFNALDLSKEFEKLTQYGGSKDLFQFLVLNEFNKIFQYDSTSKSFVDINSIINIFENSEKDSYQDLEIKIIDSDSVLSFLKLHPEYVNEVKNCIYKICSSEPFIQFKSIRETTFTWVLQDLQKIVKDINDLDEIEIDFFKALYEGFPSKYTKYQEFKFLLKRGTKLKMNYIYSIEVLNAIEKVLRGIKKYRRLHFYKVAESPNKTKKAELSLFGTDLEVKNKLPEIIEEIRESREIYSNGFIIYYVGLLQELILDHESKALQTVINVKTIIDTKIDIFKKNLKNTYDDEYMNLLRMLVLENTFIFHSSSEKFLKKLKGKISFDDLNTDNLESFGLLFEQYSKSYSFGYTSKMLSRIEIHKSRQIFIPDPPMMETFKNMLLLKSSINNDQVVNGKSDLHVKEKICLILKYCCKILNVKNGGAFFAVKYKNKDVEETNEADYAIVGEYATSTSNSLTTGHFTEKSILYNIFNGIKAEDSNRSLSCFEISKGLDNMYNFLPNDKITHLNIGQFSEIDGQSFNNLFYLRITQIKQKEDMKFESIPIAVLCFYDNQDILGINNFVRFDPKRVRQLLLLRNDINEFITYQLDNDSVRAYIEEQNQISINNAITHSFDTYVGQYVGSLSDIKDESIRQKFEILGTLILNKHLLLRFIAEYLKNEDATEAISKLSITRIEITGIDFKILAKDFVATIFSLDLSEIDIITTEQVTINIGIDDNAILIFYDFFYKELLFEVFYNIRKVYGDYIDKNDPFIIDVRLQWYNEQQYLSITNNLYNDLPNSKPPISKIEQIMLSRKQKKGLSLINTISEIMYKKRCLIKQFDDKFQIEIPIETK